MSMLPRRVLCLLVIVLYCVGVSNAQIAQVEEHSHVIELAKEAKRLDEEAAKAAEETSNAIKECQDADATTDDAVSKANSFAQEANRLLETDKGNTAEIKKKKEEGLQLLKKANDAAVKIWGAVNKTKSIMTSTAVKGDAARKASENFDKLYGREKKEYSKPPNTGNEGKLNKLIQEVEKAYPTSAKSVMKGIGQRAIDVAHEAIGEAHGATVAAQDAEKAAKLLRETIKTLEDAIATTDAVNKKQEKTHSADGQLDSQGQPQTQTLNVERQPQQSAGVSVTGDERQDQKEEKEKDAKETPTTYSNPSASSSSVAAATKTNEQVTATPTKTQEEGDKKTQVNGSNMDSLKKKSANALGELTKTVTGGTEGTGSTLPIDTIPGNPTTPKDGSSIPVLLRVPLLLLLLFSVLGCMTVC
ncbi:hypothetical protein LSM04_006718 [Trypanosoma melophagium]|uniref:uncharacterized protein n=1 Tax=Trypanosoma melophagium TaxID=715481 RepID=UPI00351A808F|nr:hypothetical protein LSM04_006718 [Trypanosoma melophagium]